MWNFSALGDAIVMGTFFQATYFLSSKREKTVYLISLHIAILLLFLREFSPLVNGQGIVSVSWGLYAIALFVFGLRKNRKEISQVAMATVMLLVAKLFLIDLAHLETLWRILLFLGFGVVLLLLSYYFKALWKKDS